jgi:hypothetical protein
MVRLEAQHGAGIGVGNEMAGLGKLLKAGYHTRTGGFKWFLPPKDGFGLLGTGGMGIAGGGWVGWEASGDSPQGSVGQMSRRTLWEDAGGHPSTSRCQNDATDSVLAPQRALHRGQSPAEGMGMVADRLRLPP